MGLITKGKANAAETEAKKQYDAGHTILVYQFAGRLIDMWGVVSGMAEQIEAIENQGWRLEQMVFGGQGKKGDAVQIGYFRRHDRFGDPEVGDRPTPSGPPPPPPPSGEGGEPHPAA
jgi:hypothetical protein